MIYDEMSVAVKKRIIREALGFYVRHHGQYDPDHRSHGVWPVEILYAVESHLKMNIKSKDTIERQISKHYKKMVDSYERVTAKEREK